MMNSESLDHLVQLVSDAVAAHRAYWDTKIETEWMSADYRKIDRDRTLRDAATAIALALVAAVATHPKS